MIKPALVLVACLGSAALPLHAQGLRIPGSGSGPSLMLPPASAATTSSTASQRQADYIVAVVNSEPLTNNEVRARALRFQQQAAQQGQAAQLPPRDIFLGQVMERLISEKAQLQYAREIGIKIDDSQVDNAEANIAAQNQLSVADFRRRLSSEGIDSTRFREDLRGQLILQRLRERDFEQRVKISDTEADQFLLEQNATVDATRLELNIAQILIAVPETATPAQVTELQARAQRAYERARAGEDFAALARELSSAPDARESGGAMGLRKIDRYPELFTDAVRTLSTGGVAAPIRSGAGFHVLKLVEKRQGGGIDSTVVENHARHILLRIGAQMTQAQAVERLAAIKRRVQAGGDFAALARETSQDGSAKDGGDLGWSRPGQFVPEFEEALEKLAVGQVSDPVLSRFGVHLIQLLERREARLTQREQREIARNMLREKRLDETYANWAQDIRARAYVEMRESPQ
jgi:peptidyl-prolyl cis-trans isomerase SurA